MIQLTFRKTDRQNSSLWKSKGFFLLIVVVKNSFCYMII